MRRILQKGMPALALAMAGQMAVAANTISVNFYKEQGEVSGTYGIVPSSSWYNISKDTLTADLAVEGYAQQAKLTYSRPSAYQWTDATDAALKGFLDDNAKGGDGRIQISVTDIPFACYDVIVYQSTESSAMFNPPQVNGLYYSYDGSLFTTQERSAELRYGGKSPKASVGANVVYLKKGFSGDLTINGCRPAYNSSRDTIISEGRGCIAAIQIVETSKRWGNLGRLSGEGCVTSVAWQDMKSSYELKLGDQTGLCYTGIGMYGETVIREVKLALANTDPLVPTSVSITDGEKTITSAGVVVKQETIYGKGAISWTTQVATFTFDSSAAFDASATLRMSVSGSWRGMVAKPVNDTLSDGEWSPVVLVSGLYTAPNSIAVNFASERGAARSGSGAVPAAVWNDVPGTSTAVSNLKSSDGSASTAKLTVVGNTATWGDASTDPMLKGYLDDSADVSIAITGIPYRYYDVVVFQASDTAGNGFNPPCVNGRYYSYDGSVVSAERNDVSVRYGATRRLAPNCGMNTACIRGGFSGDLTIAGAGNAFQARGGIAGVQIVEAEPPPEYEAVVSSDTDWDKIAWNHYVPDAGFEQNARIKLTVVGTPTISFTRPLVLGANSRLLVEGLPVFRAADGLYADGCWEKTILRVSEFEVTDVAFAPVKEGFKGAYEKTETGFLLRAQNREVISVNLAGGSMKEDGGPIASPEENRMPESGTLFGLAPSPATNWNEIARRWRNVSCTESLAGVEAFDGTGRVRRETVSVAASAIATGQADEIADPVLRGYLDDAGDGASVVIHGIPYKSYDVIVYGTSDGYGAPLAPLVINGKSYTGENGAAAEGTSDWGVGLYVKPELGKNALMVTGCVGDTVTILGARSVTGGRAAIGAVQIVCQGEVTTKEEYSTVISGSVRFSDIVWDYGKVFREGQLNEVTILVTGTEPEDVEIFFDNADMMLGKLTIVSARNIRLVADRSLPHVGQFDISQCTGRIAYGWPVDSLEMTKDGKIAYFGGSGTATLPAPISFVDGGNLTLAEKRAPYYVGRTYNVLENLPYTMDFTNAEVYANGLVNDFGDTGLGVGRATVTVSGNSVVSAQSVVIACGQEGAEAALTVRDDAQVVVTGTVSQDSDRNSVMFGRDGPSTFALRDRASFTTASDVLFGTSSDDHAINIYGGMFTARGIKASGLAGGVNSVNLFGGELVLGASGIASYGTAEIQVDVAGDAQITASSALDISQDVTIESGKTLTFNAVGGMISLVNCVVENNGTNVIASGTVRIKASGAAYKGTGTIVVKRGATLDYCGYYLTNPVIVEEGGAVVNSGTALSADKPLQLSLAGDATLGGPSKMLFGTQSRLELNGHTLTIAQKGCLTLSSQTLSGGNAKIRVGSDTDGMLALAADDKTVTVLEDIDVEVSARGKLDLSTGTSLTCRNFSCAGEVLGSKAKLIVTGTLDATGSTRVKRLAIADGATLVGTQLKVDAELTLGKTLFVSNYGVKAGQIATVPAGTSVGGTKLVYNGRHSYVLVCSDTVLSVVYFSNNWIAYADANDVRREGDVYVVTSAEGLAWIAASAADKWFSGAVALDADLDLTYRNWTPIAQFTGSFDGRGHTIRGLNNTNVVEDYDARYVGGPTNDWRYSAYGLFATSKDANFHDVTLSEVAISNVADSVAALLGVHAGGNLTVRDVTVASGRVQGEGRAVAGILTVGGKGDGIGDVTVTDNANRATVVGRIAATDDGGNAAQVLAGTTWGTTFGEVDVSQNAGEGTFDVRVTDGVLAEAWTRSGFSWMDLPICNLAPAVLRTDAAGTFSRYVEANEAWAIPVDPVRRTARMSVGNFANGGANILGWWTDQVTAVGEGASIVVTNNGASVELDGWSTVSVDRNVDIDLNGNSVYCVYDCDVFEIADGKTLTVRNGKISVGPGCEAFAGKGSSDARGVEIVRLSENFEERTFAKASLTMAAPGMVTLAVPLTCSSCLYGVEAKTALTDDWQVVPEGVQYGNGGALELEVPAEAASGFYRVSVMVDAY